MTESIKISWHQNLRQVLSWRMLVALAMGFSGGLPLLLSITILQAWMKQEGLDLTTIGIFSLVGLPYTLKFIWAPLIDRYIPPFLGRRRGWLLIAQLFTIVAIFGLGSTDPGINPWVTGIAALILAFFSATQDIVIDAYRRESLSESEQAFGASLYVNGYRFGMLLASGGGLILADIVSFPQVYSVMAGFMLIGVVTTLLAPEPDRPEGTPETMLQAVVLPFLDFFKRKDSVLILLFILLYKVGDMMASHMTIPFYLELGFSNTEIGAIVKLIAFWATLGGTLVGGLLYLRIGVYRALWAFGILQGVSTAGFALLATIGYSIPWLTAVIGFENLSAGMGMSAYIAFMAHLTNKKFTATQYALLTSLMGIPRVIIAAPTGYMAQTMGWFAFFMSCALIAIPGLLLLFYFRGWMMETADDAGATESQ